MYHDSTVSTLLRFYYHVDSYFGIRDLSTVNDFSVINRTYKSIFDARYRFRPTLGESLQLICIILAEKS